MIFCFLLMEHHPFVSGKVDACDVDLRTEHLLQGICLIVKAENATGLIVQRQRTAEPVQPHPASGSDFKEFASDAPVG